MRTLISRQAVFSVGRRLANSTWDEQKNASVYGKDIRPHGADYSLDVAYGGPVSTEDGMILNLTEMKPALARAIQPLDGRFLSEELEEFRSDAPTAERISQFILLNLPPSLGSGTLARLRLQESRRTRVEVLPTCMRVTRSYEFAAAHRLHAPFLTESENRLRYDKCSNLAGHGHNYRLEVCVEGTPDAESGFIIPPLFLDELVDQEIYTRFDHKHLNVDCAEFSELIPTSENLAQVIFNILRARLQAEGYTLARIGLHETQKNYFEVEA
jgi:6-pyruvoyltetrahydropterin/6-carboxytetrahydropterin synthase